MVRAVKELPEIFRTDPDLHHGDLESIRFQIDTLHGKTGIIQDDAEKHREYAAGLRSQPILRRMLVKSDGKFIILQMNDIDWIEAWGDYVRLHCKGKTHVARRKIGDIEHHLDLNQFVRINRSAIINIDRMKELEPLNHGDYLLTLHDNTQLNLSRNYRIRLSVLFDQSI